MKTTTDEDLPGIPGKPFYLLFDRNWFEIGDILNDNIVIIGKPRTKWYHRLLNIVTFGFYKLRITYKVKFKK